MRTNTLAVLVMVMVQLGFAVMNIMSKVVIDSGMNPLVHVAYRQIFASMILIPFAYFIERGKRPPMTMSIFFQIFFLSIIGQVLNQILYFVGLKMSTATIACALNNLIPALTFILAVLFKQESAKIKTTAGQAKVIGTIVSVTGAMILTLYHGPVIPIGESRIHLNTASKMHNSDNSYQRHLLGSCLIIIGALSFSVWFIFQAKMCDRYPAPYSSSALMLLMAAIQSFLVGLVMEPSLHSWTLLPPIRAISSIYAGVVCSAFGLVVMSWCIERKGALFVAVFNPLLLIIVAALSWGLISEKLYLGTILGSLLIVGGIYSVLWGKSKEVDAKKKIGIVNSPPQEEKQETKDMEMQ